MISGISASLSGIANALRRLDITANNIANQQTPGYRTLRSVNLEIVENQGNIDSMATSVSSPLALADLTGRPGIESSNVDPALEQVNLLLSRRQFETNLTALRVQDEILGSLLHSLDQRS